MREGPRMPITRRGFVGGLVGGLLGAASFAYPGFARVLAADVTTDKQDSQSSRQQADPLFAVGKVELKANDSLILTSLEGQRVVIVPAGRSVWKEVAVSIDNVEIGDYVMARGDQLRPDGALLARAGWIWANIGQWHGRVNSVDPRGMVVRRRDGLTRPVQFSATIDVIKAKDRTPLPNGIAAIAAGAEIGAVGLVLPDRSLRATRVWVYP